MTGKEVLLRRARFSAEGDPPEEIDQFTHAGGHRQRLPGPDILSHVADQEPVPRREEEFEEQIPVVKPADTVPPLVVPAHQVKARGTAVAREGAVGHPKEADDPERKTPHRLHGAEGDPSGEEASAAPVIFQFPPHDVRQDRSGEFLRDAGASAPGG